MNNNLFGINQKSYKTIINLFSEIPELDKVVIYGSRALGTYKNGSDIDFAIFTDSNKDLSAKILFQLDELPTPYFFDVLDYNNLNNKNLKEHIDKFGKEFYKK